jgi:CRP-like cAMP-binding protein
LFSSSLYLSFHVYVLLAPIPTGDYILKKGTKGTTMKVVVTGDSQVILDGGARAPLNFGPGKAYGETVLFQENCKRSADVKVASSIQGCRVLSISKADIVTVLAESAKHYLALFDKACSEQVSKKATARRRLAQNMTLISA